MNYPIFSNYILKCGYWLIQVVCYRIYEYYELFTWIMISSISNVVILDVLMDYD